MATYLDLHEIAEDKRITTIGRAAMAGHVVAFITDDEPGKLDRYISKLLARFPNLELIEKFNGPIAGVVGAKLKLKSGESTGG